MADLNEQSWKWAQRAEKELHATLAEKDPTFRDIDHQIAQYRTLCEDLILQDFEFALSKDVENRLWNAHVKINARFRKQLSTFRTGSGKKKLVEHRKVIKHYLDFIKSSQRFYRKYIQRLDSTYDGIPGLRAVASKLSLDSLSTSSQLTPSNDLGNAVLTSCHRTLVRLGDLSRYRETEVVGKEHNWAPAIGYYVLAGDILPASGASHNQLAVIARTDVNHLDAIYHLYRALAVEEPHPAAQGNLELEFRKIHEAWDKDETIANGQGPGKALVGCYMRLHARCYNGVDFAEHDEVENEILSQLAVGLKERPLEGILCKLIVINLAAESFAVNRLFDAPNSVKCKQSFFFFLRLNVRTFTTLLQALQRELGCLTGAEEEASGDNGLPTNTSARITAVIRRVLPGLRHYSSWLAIRAEILAAPVDEHSLNVQIKELWKNYASTLTLLASTFSVEDLPEIEYILEEDVDVLGFKPLEHECRIRRYYDEISATRKPRYYDQGVKVHHCDVEILGRIRDILMDGAKLQLDESTPIKLLDTLTFAYHEEGTSELAGSPEIQQANLSFADGLHQAVSRAKDPIPPNAASTLGEAASEVASVSDSTTHHWVDTLVGSEGAGKDLQQKGSRSEFVDSLSPTPANDAFEDSPAKAAGNDTSYDLIGTATAQDLLQDAGNDTSYGLIGTLTARDLVNDLRSYSPQHKHQSPPPLPYLPSILNSPFAPQLGEAESHIRPNTAIRMTTHSPRTSQNGFAIQHQPANTYSVTSTASSIPDPSISTFQRPKNQALPPPPNGYYGVIGRPSTKRGVGNAMSKIDASDFHSSSIVPDSSWDAPRRSAVGEAATVLTPPNGQGGG